MSSDHEEHKDEPCSPNLLINPDTPSISFCDQHLGDKECVALCEQLRSCSSGHVTTLDLRGNQIRHGGAVAISELLRVNATIKNLSLEWNFIGTMDQGIQALASALEINNSLVSLDLRNNDIGPEGGRALAKGLAVNVNLRRLDVRWNNIGISGGKALAHALCEDNTTLTECQVSGNKMSEESVSVIDAATKRNGSGHGKSHVLSGGTQVQLFHNSNPQRRGRSGSLSSLVDDQFDRVQAEKQVQMEQMLREMEIEQEKLRSDFNAEARLRHDMEERALHAESDLEHRTAQLEGTVKTLTQELDDCRQQLYDAKEALRNEKTATTAAKLELGKKVQEISLELNRESTAHHDAKSLAERLQLTVDTLRDETTSLKDELENNKSHFASIQETLQASVTEATEKAKENIEKANKRCADEVGHLRAAVDAAKKDRDAEAGLVNDLKHQVLQQKTEFETQLHNLEEQWRTKLRDARHQLEVVREEKLAVSQEASEAIAAHEAKLDAELAKVNERADKTRDTLTLQVEKEKTTCQDLRRAMHQLKVQVETEMTTTADAKNQVEILHMDLETKELQRKELEKRSQEEKTKLKAQHHEVREQLNEQVKRIASRDATIQELQLEIAQLKSSKLEWTMHIEQQVQQSIAAVFEKANDQVKV